MGIEENKALIRRLYDEVMGRRDLSVLDELVSPDFVELDPPMGQEQGRDGLRRWFAAFLRAFPDAVWTLESQLAEGERVMSLFEWRGTQREDFFGVRRTDRTVATASLYLDTIENGQLVARRSFHDGLGFLQQLGQIPPPGGTRPL